jgi:hypothetical protein
VVGRDIGDQEKRLALALHVVVDRQSGYVDLRHSNPFVMNPGIERLPLEEA